VTTISYSSRRARVSVKQEGAAAAEPYRWNVVRPGHLSKGARTTVDAARGLIAWFKRHPQVADALLGVVLLLLGVLTVIGAPESARPAGHDKEPGVLGFALILIMTVALTWRRRAPFAVLAVIIAADIAYYQLGFMSTAADFLAILIMAYTVGSRRPGWLGVLVLATAVLTYSTTAIAKDGKISDFAGALVVLGGSWAIGRNVGLRRAYVHSLEERATQVEHLREAELRDVVYEERARIARELHDVVAHHVSVMTVQASAALRQLDRDSDRSREALTSVEEVGRAALSEMRRMVNVLREINAERAEERPDGQVRADTSELMPQPAIADLPGLVDQMTQAGLPVTLTVEGGEGPALSPGVELTAYRVVQEALTNTLKHAGPAEADVLLRYGPRDLVVQVTDSGRGLAADLGRQRNGVRPVGHGLLGMRERVELYGGALYAGPRRGGGYEVRVRIPIEQVSG
jgi:signal transduction histidine kinase